MSIRTGIRDPRPQGPQFNKWGYVNNPNWTSTATGPLAYTPGDQPQVWSAEEQGEAKVINTRDQHHPCGYWYKKED
jgi:hypothetical protein